jgi:hypothetical protein
LIRLGYVAAVEIPEYDCGPLVAIWNNSLVSLDEEGMGSGSVQRYDVTPGILPCSKVGGFMATIKENLDDIGPETQTRVSNIVSVGDTVARDVKHGLKCMSVNLSS